ncbi:MAG: hypothetical protein Q7W30_08505 [Coriobacteriia bacterium]|nr:hypothetical protein [Coriobacteriia bacterium]
MANQMAILQEIDKCMRCNGCVISCKRTWKMKGIVPANDLPHAKLDSNQRVVIKSQKRSDNGPFVRFSCWHCVSPPCAVRCPFKAIKKDAASGAVYIDAALCNPSDPKCAQQCRWDCQRGGYPKIGIGSDAYTTPKATKCTLCHGRAGLGLDGLGGDLPTKAKGPEITAVAEKAHQPACVFTCPANAMVYDTRDAIMTKITTEGYVTVMGDGAMFWASKKFNQIAPPKADPFVEDHITPMVASLANSPFAKAALAPTLVVGGLLALAARRAKVAEEAASAGEVQ